VESYYDEVWEDCDFRQRQPGPAEYEQCVFRRCVFGGAALEGSVFIDCVFEDCDASNATVGGTSLREVVFRRCKLLGIRFDRCNTAVLGVRFRDCNLSFCCFAKLSLRHTSFVGCVLRDADFGEADLAQSDFSGSDLGGALFHRTVLTGADLRTAHGMTLDAEQNTVAGARFSAEGALGLLAKYRLRIE
jgi:uncharacterized protein YjbI with pentapeptide repeats